jgi:hypothetical protein
MVSPSNSQREQEASASFGSSWMYCASRRRWESYWEHSRWGTYNQVSPKICSKPARSSQQILHDRHMEFIWFLDAQEAKWGNQH